METKLNNGVTLLTHDDHIGNIINRSKNFYEIQMLKDIGRNRDIDTIIDVGANIGNHTIFFGGIAKKVYSFEPQADNFKLLVDNIFNNNMKGSVEPFQFCVSDKYEKKGIECEASNMGMAKMVEGNKIKCLTLDKFLEDYPGSIDVIKVDVEGFELKVLKGAKRIIKEHKPVIYVECQTRNEFNSIQSFLVQFGYKKAAVFNSTPTYKFQAV